MHTCSGDLKVYMLEPTWASRTRKVAGRGHFLPLRRIQNEPVGFALWALGREADRKSVV